MSDDRPPLSRWGDVRERLDDERLFVIETPPPVTLADKFLVPPVSVLDRRTGAWRDRRRRWLTMGIESERGRAAGAVATMVEPGRRDFLARIMRGERVDGRRMGALVAGGVSVFDPVVCELAYRWHTLPGDRVLDPFAGGSVRGVVASTLARYYVGVDLSHSQVAANRNQLRLCGELQPRWIEGDSARIDDLLGADEEFDALFSCPPYGDLERYSDDPRDLSAMSPANFTATHRRIVEIACARLRPDRFAVWVVSDIRDRHGAYRGLVGDTIQHFARAGLSLHNDAILLDQVGAAAIRAERPFRATRKLARVHQHMLIFVKGSAKRATDRLREDANGADS